MPNAVTDHSFLGHPKWENGASKEFEHDKLQPIAFVSAKEIVERTRISRAHLHNLVRNHKFPAPVTRGRRFTRWLWSDVLNYINNPRDWPSALTRMTEQEVRNA